ncbi:hypothetical protein [Actinophytocola gossypii]|uniref:Lipoprotein n=1 Tax=Actinophytocola gossypii TaxID=2812003 RepID=A0ABT2JF56_9PSEU|nr:hypothetical protein [Actinophytocola gossypii]MCT2586383.1 hypothetical protein [Actinophytocola gossypii]
MWRIVRALACALLLAGCSASDDPGDQGDQVGGHGHHRAPNNDPQLIPAGKVGAPALGQPVESMDELTAWVREVTGECADPAEADAAELADYLGPTRVEWYGPFVAEWATCGIEPHDRLGLVLFEPGQQRALQEFWLRGLESGELAENPDWAFGNGFAVTAGPLGTQRLGLHYLWCEPVDLPDAHTVPADVEGCVYARP